MKMTGSGELSELITRIAHMSTERGPDRAAISFLDKAD